MEFGEVKKNNLAESVAPSSVPIIEYGEFLGTDRKVKYPKKPEKRFKSFRALLFRFRTHWMLLGLAVLGCIGVFRFYTARPLPKSGIVATTSIRPTPMRSRQQAPSQPNPIVSSSDAEAQRARQLKNAAIEEMMQTRRLTEQNLLSETDLANQERKIKASLETALAASNKALSQNPKHEVALAQKAAILFLLERFEEARVVAERGTSLYPDNADLKEARQRILQRLDASARAS